MPGQTCQKQDLIRPSTGNVDRSNVYVPDTLGEGPGSLWDASGKPSEPPGVITGGVRLGIHSALYAK